MATVTENNPLGKSLESLASSLKGYKGHLTRHITIADRILQQYHSVGPSLVIRDELQEVLTDLKAAYKKVETSLLAMTEMTVAEEQASLIQKLDTEHDRFGATYDTIVECLSRVEQDLRPRQQSFLGGGHPAAGRAKPMTSLKPKCLSRDATPVEVTQWIKTFTAYFTASQFAEATLLEQQAHFKSSLDAFLASKVDQHITPATPVLPNPTGPEVSCMEYLREEFLILKPLFSRRLDYFNYKQQKGQLFTDWYDKLTKKGDEADLPALSVDDLAAMRILTGVEDAVLKQEFLRSPRKDAKSLLAVAQNYELGQRYVRSMTGPAVTAANVNMTSKNSKGKKGHNGQKANTYFKDGKCFRCGMKLGNTDFSVHKESCKAREHTCKKCGKTGHFPSVCLSTHGATANQKKPSPGGVQAANVQSQASQPEGASSQQGAESVNTVRS